MKIYFTYLLYKTNIFKIRSNLSKNSISLISLYFEHNTATLSYKNFNIILLVSLIIASRETSGPNTNNFVDVTLCGEHTKEILS